MSVSQIVRLAFDSQELLELKEELEVVIGNLTADGLLLVANTNLVNAFFLSFVFLIVVVLMNLLNGLAVSDTGLIQAKAEIYSYINQVF